jgi:exopolyphosphatase/guanosine-5'-triphosphate,3'-diphosphate pyrophosphatase
MRLAAIDIGTNTILMLIAQISHNNEINILHEEYAIARLGEDTDKTGVINADAILRAEKILQKCVNICKKFDVQSIFTVATSAMRDAKNSAQVKMSFESILQFPVLIIDGKKEATLSFIGTVNSPNTSMVIDIGGGSTEIIVGQNKQILFKQSLDIGAVRIFERFFNMSHPPTQTQIDSTVKYICELLADLKSELPKYSQIYSVAGTATTIASTLCGVNDYKVREIDNYHLTAEKLDEVYNLYLSSTVDEIIGKYLVSPGRAN